MIKVSDKKISIDEAKNTGMAMTLIILLIAISSRNFAFTILAVILLVIIMVFTLAYRPVAVILFSLVVTPVGVIRNY